MKDINHWQKENHAIGSKSSSKNLKFLYKALLNGNVPMFLPDAWLDKREVEIIKRAIKQKTLALLWMRAITKLSTSISFSYSPFGRGSSASLCCRLYRGMTDSWSINFRCFIPFCITVSLAWYAVINHDHQILRTSRNILWIWIYWLQNVPCEIN